MHLRLLLVLALLAGGSAELRAVVTLLTASSAGAHTTVKARLYVHAFLLFFESLKRSGCRLPVHVLVTDEVPAHHPVRVMITRYGARETVVPTILGDGAPEYWRDMFSKLFVMNLTQYERVLFYDADHIFLADPEQAFDACPPGAFCACQDGGLASHFFNAGFFVATPSQATMARWMARADWARGNEMDFLNTAQPWVEIPARFNLMPKAYHGPPEGLEDFIGGAVAVHEKWWALKRGSLEVSALNGPQWIWNDNALSESYDNENQLAKNADTWIARRNDWLLPAVNQPEMARETKEFSMLTMRSPSTVALMSPYFACPWTLWRSFSVADRFDGGKWVCGVKEMQGRPCTVYSFGSHGEDEFEAAAAEVAPLCEIHIFDPTPNGGEKLAQVKKRWGAHFHEVGLCMGADSFTAGGVKYPCRSLQATMEALGHTSIDVLKMDIEGSEWAVLADTPWADLNVGQVIVEVHDFGGSITLPQLIRDYWGPLERAGLLQYAIEPVCASCGGQYEVAFLNRHWHPHTGFV